MNISDQKSSPGSSIYAGRDHSERVRLSEIDASLRVPGVFFIVSAVGWLMIGTVLALLASLSIKGIHLPDWLAKVLMTQPELGFGRTRAAHLNAMAYGWGVNVIFAVIIWLMARLSRTPVRHGGLLLIGGVFWNIGVTVGVAGILAGDMTSVEWLEMPGYAPPLLAVSYLCVGIWGILCFHYRKSGHVYVSQWYILAALFWFPWLYMIAQMMIFYAPARGTIQAIVNWWFAHNVLGLWFTPAGLAAAYYLIPKVLGRPVHSYYLSVLGFWTLALFYNWAGVHHLIGGPIPIWLQAAGTVGSVGMVIPVVVVAINHHLTVKGHFKQVWQSPTLRFVVFGAMSYTAVSLLGSTMSLRDVNVITHFTHFTVGHAHHGVYAFFTMVMFGTLYFMLPRLVNLEWPSAFLIRVHFWFCALGIGVMVVGLHIGGWIQGLMMNDPEIPFMQTMEATLPYLWSRSVSGLMLTIGHIAFGINVFLLLIRARGTDQPKLSLGRTG